MCFPVVVVLSWSSSLQVVTVSDIMIDSLSLALTSPVLTLFCSFILGNSEVEYIGVSYRTMQLHLFILELTTFLIAGPDSASFGRAAAYQKRDWLLCSVDIIPGWLFNSGDIICKVNLLINVSISLLVYVFFNFISYYKPFSFFFSKVCLFDGIYS